eukprot:7488221-Alexandrium_andersonii.AAC.1
MRQLAVAGWPHCNAEGLLEHISELSWLGASDELERLASAGLSRNDQAFCKAMRWASLWPKERPRE